MLASYAWYELGAVIGRPALWFVGISALLLSVLANPAWPTWYLWTGWRVPRQWRVYGYPTYGAIFGFVLGLGFLTEIASVGYYFLPIWNLSSLSFAWILPPSIAFGFARFLPVVLAIRQSPPDRDARISALGRTEAIGKSLSTFEFALLLGIGTAFTFVGLR